MDRNQKFVVTINRELGSGGRTVGRLLAEKLGVEFFDKAHVRAIEEKFNLTIDEIERIKGKKDSWWTDFMRVGSIGHGISYTPYERWKDGPQEPTTENVFKAEKEILLGIAEEESCVIAGRLGFSIFKNHPNHFSIFIQASMPYRLERVMRKQGLSEADAKNVIEKVDKMREEYVKKFSGTSRYDTRNYNLVISMDGKTEEQVVDIILKTIG
jgi:cytidylate kinase